MQHWQASRPRARAKAPPASFPLYPASPKQVHDRQQDDRSEQRYDQSAEAEVALVDGAATHQRSDQPTGQQGADDTYHNIESDPLLGVGIHDLAGQPPD